MKLPFFIRSNILTATFLNCLDTETTGSSHTDWAFYPYGSQKLYRLEEQKKE